MGDALADLYASNVEENKGNSAEVNSRILQQLTYPKYRLKVENSLNLSLFFFRILEIIQLLNLFLT